MDLEVYLTCHFLDILTLHNQLCGAERAGHFDGVATVIIRLIRIIRPEKIILGEKDWQQYIIIRQLIQDFGLSIKVEGIATVRNAQGLALSSRNKYLNPSNLLKAIELPRILNKASRDFKEAKEMVLVPLSFICRNKTN